uniref:Reverse transcriptase domain-containing protein n=1 Tax=Photinus pyralis TaxID=7054 RepID=A0A1Y1KQJ6_PHOPY
MQQVPVIVGQTFLNRTDVTLLLRDHQTRLFENHLAALPDVASLPPRKLPLWSKNAAVIPPNTIDLIEIANQEHHEGEVYVEATTRQKSGGEYNIPGCVTTIGGVIAIQNISTNHLTFRQHQLIARGTPCENEISQNEVSKLVINASTLPSFQLNDIKGRLGSNLNESECILVLNLINEFRNCFAGNTTELGKTTVTEMQIRLNDDVPVTYRPYRLAYPERESVRGIVQDLIANGIVQESQSPYASPILLVKKKTGEYRMCVDYRALNLKTIRDKYPLPLVDDDLERMHGNDSVAKTAFVTPDGHYEYLRMPFGLVNAPAVFLRAINSILGKLRFTTAMAYLDDILLPSSSFETGLGSLREVFTLFRDAGMTFRLSKCQFFHEKLEYLGHEISPHGIRPGIAKIEAVEKYPKPTNVHEIRQFLG